MTELMQRLRARIAQAGGWIPFDTYMAEALYAPGLGYYSSGRPTFGLTPQSGSDFVTAPEMSPLFGQALARQVAQALAETGVDQVWEFGAGSGALAESVLDALQALSAAPRRYTIVDLSGSLRARQQERLARFGAQVQWLDALPDAVEGVLIGNEVLDAMPVKLLHFDGAAWAERGVAWAGEGEGMGFIWADRPTELRPPVERADWAPGTVTELHQQAEAWVRTVGAVLKRGAMFLIDYGFGEQEYYLPARHGGTLMCHHLHQADPDPLTQVGEKDITAHVDFTGIAVAAQEAGLTVLGYTTQARFLLNCGLVEWLEGADLRTRAMAQKLLTEHEMGELFKVIGLAPEAQAFDALGFAQGDRSHRL